MVLMRQGFWFLLVGGALVVVDSLVTIALSRAGMSLEAANIIGRIAGALLGFWLNGKITFASGDRRLGPRQLIRFIIAWLLLTAVSTLLVTGIGHHFGLSSAWLAKPVVEACLAVVSFFTSRHWIYRQP
ncbi:GtrA family protein [Marilutibacter alkalisoli]|uniref:GtrA family protein n=1 Tax=Marilutibacter alkalisoli TaxID=2591633 RepID=A0A514BWA0_9GAMM|nr:GtrA family protein [Lysobacter alkalisoli]QDH71661.1 GtrA family protein [Lysobacter alkalisoli]